MDDLVVWVIIGCELGFWAVLATGLALRYLARRSRAGALVLAAIPLVDVVLLAAVAADLHRGAEVRTVHLAAGIYLGASVAFGPALVRWADVRMAHLFADGPAPQRPTGRDRLIGELRLFGRWLVAAAVALAATGLLAVTVAGPAQRADLLGIAPALGVITVLWLVTGPVWELGSLAIGRPPRADDDRHAEDTARP